MSLELWISAIDQSRFTSDERERLKNYVQKIDNSNVPIIWNLMHFSELVGIDAKILDSIVQQANSFYRSFTIPKRRGGDRQIDVPYASLMHVQRWINSKILVAISPSPWAHGFVKERSIVTNAMIHLKGEMLLKIDLKDFFPSIGLRRIIAIFRNFGYGSVLSFQLARLCTLNGGLPQGAATSPALSNIIAKRLDRRIYGLARRWGIEYSRYADDLTFSGPHISTNFLKYATAVIVAEGFSVNQKKVVLVRARSKKIVTGVSISSGVPKLPRARRREIRKEVYFLEKVGFDDHTRSINVSDPLYLERLMGRLAFWRQIEPESEYVVRAMAKVRAAQGELDRLI